MSSESEIRKETSSGGTLLGIFYRNPRLFLGVGAICSLSFLSNGIVVAQTESSTDKVAPPTTSATATAPLATPKPPAAPQSFVVPETSVPLPARVVAPPVAKKTAPAVPVVSAPVHSPAAKKPSASTPGSRTAAAPVHSPAAKKPSVNIPVRVAGPPPSNAVGKKPVIAPNISAPSTSTIAQPPKVILNPDQIQETAKTPVAPRGNFIDRTNYAAGNNTRNSKPTVVLSERSTGCSTVSSNGQLASGVCGSAAPSHQTANSRTGSSSKPRQVALARLTKAQASAPTSVKSAPLRALKKARPTRQLTAARSQSKAYSVRGTLKPADLAYLQFARRPLGIFGDQKPSFIFPLVIPASITSSFGWRLHPMFGYYHFHSGTDMAAAQGTAVIAVAPGKVETANFLGGYGLAVILRHEQETQESLYGHLSEVFVQPGEWVEQGTVIGRVGSTGNSTGPHLHFEWRHRTSEGWVAVDAGAHLEYSMAQFIEALKLVQNNTQPES
ncbi:peptidoglycan DD-metalloendopeptidase family protein [Lyngbya aestuarii]|uniref:peptidoglycan DD-metalloendopeptidase family protein n=1 Tax=Lyngbya aestuarii TaxID=118322 RepID=UPI00403E1F5C